MTSRDFCYWLQGFMEIASPGGVTAVQMEIIKKHLSLVFRHEIDPSFGDSKKQEELNKIHSPDHTKGPSPRC